MGSGKSSGYGSGKSSGYGSGYGSGSGSMDVCSIALKMMRDMMKGITGKKDITLARRVEICKSYNGMDKDMMRKVTMCKSTELQEGLAQTKKICGGKKVVATTVIETKIVKKKRVLAQQGISKGDGNCD